MPDKPFARFAAECGLAYYPDPSGERYLYRTDGGIACKKSEHPGFIDELWNALVRIKGESDDLLLGKN